jgi:hypothetical protein
VVELLSVAKKIEDNRLFFTHMKTLLQQAYDENKDDFEKTKDEFDTSFSPASLDSLSDSLLALCEMWRRIRAYIDTLSTDMQEARLKTFRERLSSVRMNANERKHVMSALNLVKSSAQVRNGGRKPVLP